MAITSKLSTGDANSTESIEVSGFGEDSARTTNGEFSPNTALCNINGLTGFKSGATLTTGFGVLSTSTETTDFGISFELIVATATGAESVARTNAGAVVKDPAETFVTASGAESVTSIDVTFAGVDSTDMSEILFGKVPPDIEIGAEGVDSASEDVTGFGLLSPDTEVTVAGVESTAKEDNGFGVESATAEVMSFGEDSGSIELIGFGELCGVTEDTASGSRPTDTEVTPVLISATT